MNFCDFRCGTSKTVFRRLQTFTLVVAIFVSSLLASTAMAGESSELREVVDLDFDWRFKLFEIYNDAEKTEDLETGPTGLEASIVNTRDWGADWKTWSTKQRLAQGANQIRLSTLGRGGMNIDELLVKQ